MTALTPLDGPDAVHAAPAAPEHVALWKRLPVLRQVRTSVGLQRTMLVTGLVLVAIFVVTAMFAPLLAPYGYSQLSVGDVNFGSQQPPSAEHWLGTTVGGYDVLSRTIWGARPAALVIVVAVVLSIFLGVAIGLRVRVLRRLGRPRARRDRGRAVRVPVAAARHRRRHRHQRRPVVDVGRRHGGRHLPRRS